MKLIGYIKEKKENTFQIPLYADSSGGSFCHTVDERYNIIAFQEIALKDLSFKTLYLSKNFEIGAKGALVFRGKEEYLQYNSAPLSIEEIIYYLNDHPAANTEAILDEAILMKNRIFSDHFVVDNFVVKMNPGDEQIILTFDFPTPKKEILSVEDAQLSSPELLKKKEQARFSDQEKDQAMTKAITYLNSVDMNFELKLKLRAEERRSKLKTFNYEFKLNQNSSKRQAPGE